MKVKEFIKELMEYDQNMEVKVKNSEEGEEEVILEHPVTRVVYKGDHDSFVSESIKDIKVVLIE